MQQRVNKKMIKTSNTIQHKMVAGGGDKKASV